MREQMGKMFAKFVEDVEEGKLPIKEMGAVLGFATDTQDDRVAVSAGLFIPGLSAHALGKTGDTLDVNQLEWMSKGAILGAMVTQELAKHKFSGGDKPPGLYL